MRWNRLEGRPRTEDFDRALKAEVRDALWMLSKQWQMGEFKGDDAGSPILAKVHVQATQLTKYQAGEQTQALENELPLEVKVEHQAIPFTLGGQEVSLDIRLLMGRQWLKMVGRINPSLPAEFTNLSRYTIQAPTYPAIESEAYKTAHIKVWQELAAIGSQKRMDGYALYEQLTKASPEPASTHISTSSEAEKQTVNDLGDQFVAWFQKLYVQPTKEQPNQSWKPSYLEHQFSCSAPIDDAGGEKVLVAEEYYHGHLDWYNLDIDQSRNQLGTVDNSPSLAEVEQSFTLSFLPSPMTFAGMPHTRWWSYEDWKTNLGGITPDTTDLNKLLLMEFGLIYANDWFLVPFTLPVGSLANVRGLSVRNVFGENIWIEAAGTGRDEDWKRWSMYNLAIQGNEDVPADLSLLLLPAAPKVMESKALEECFLLRDEIANMVWGVETWVPLATGKSKPGREAGLELFNKFQQFIPPPPPTPAIENEAKIRYQVVNRVPEQWIPFIPARKEGDPSHRQIQLQRAAMPRLLEGDTKIPRKVEPRTTLLREGLDNSPADTYFLHEEEVPRAGISVRKSFQRTRWCDGQVYTWIGIRKQTGRGEGHSGLAFDQLLPKE